jgi:hypothetical protein
MKSNLKVCIIVTAFFSFVGCGKNGVSSTDTPSLQSMSSSLPQSLQASSIKIGIWGGSDAQLVVSSTGTVLNLDCAQGHINGPILLDSAGKFNTAGTYQAASGVYIQPTGPVPPGTQPILSAGQPVHYQGVVTDDKMDFRIVDDATGATQAALPYHSEFNSSLKPSLCYAP